MRTLSEVAAKLWRHGLPVVEEELARAGGAAADVLRRALARAAHLLARAESEQELSDALVLRLTGVSELAAMVASHRATRPGLTCRWPMPDQPGPALVRVLDCQGDAIRCTWSADGRWLASISDGIQPGTGNTVRLWDARTWRPGPVIEHGAGWQNRIHDCVVPSGDWLATCAAGAVWIWDVDSGDVRELFAGRLVAAAPDGTWLAIAHPDTSGQPGRVTRYRMPDGEPVDATDGEAGPIPLVEHTEQVTSRAVSPDGALLADGCQDGTIWLWDLHQRGADQRRTPLLSCAVDPAGSWLATTGGDWSADGPIAIVDLDTGRRRQVFESGWYRSCVPAPDGTWLAVVSGDSVLVLDTATGRLRHRIHCPVLAGAVLLSADRNHVTDLAVAPDGTWLAAACEDGTVRVLDVATGQTSDVLDHPAITGRMLSCVIAPDASWLAYSGVGGTVVHDLSSGTSRHVNNDSRLFDVAPDGSLLASERAADIHVWAVATGETSRVLSGHLATRCQWSPDGSHLASIGDHAVRIWTGGELATTIRLNTTPTDCRWLPTGRSLAVTSQHGLHLFDGV